MSRYKKSLLAALLIAAPIIAGATGIAVAQMRAPMGLSSASFDPAQLPEFKGKVAQYTVSPRGEVDGLILADGTEVQVPPHLSSALVFSVKPGDAVSIRGLKARAIAMVSAVTITNDASGLVVGGADAGGRPEFARMEASGKIRALLHTPRGDVGGALLEDGTVLRMPPPEAAKLAGVLVVGQPVVARGMGIASPLGKSLGVLEIGQTADKLTKLDVPRFHHGPHGPGPHGPGMHGPGGMMGDAPPPPKP